MSSINFEVKKVKATNKISDKQLDAFKFKEDKKDDKLKKSKKKMVIPLLNKQTTIRHKITSADSDTRKRSAADNIPFNLKKLKEDVEIGDNVKEGDYEDVPIEDFGLAIFRGMGWKDGTKGVSAPVVVPRSKGLGLGAEKISGWSGDGELKKGGCCEVIAGKMKGCVGMVEGWDEVRVIIQLEGGVEALNPNFVVDISQEEYEAKRKNRHGQNGDAEKSEKDTKIIFEEKKTNGKHSGGFECSDVEDDDELPWLHEDLVVRVVSRSYRGGQFYKQKVIVVDVTSPHTCMCRSDKQQILEGMKQSMLETVVPKEDGCSLLILKHPHKFKKARLVERRNNNKMAVVRLDGGGDDDDEILQIHYDHICLYKPPY